MRNVETKPQGAKRCASLAGLEVVGVIVRSRGAIPASTAGLKSIVGGELRAMTNLMIQTRREALDRMIAEAEAIGANAVIAVRFDVEAIAEGWTGVCAYGTAVRARPLQLDDHAEPVTDPL